jgi:elongation factor P
MVATSANSMKVGNIIDFNGKLYVVAKPPVHTKPGKGGAFIQAELKELKGGSKLNQRFRSDENVDKVRLEARDYQFLYAEGSNLVLMNQSTFEQIDLDGSILEDKIAFLKEGMIVIVEMHDETPLMVHLPDTVILEIVEADAVIKGQTAASSYKPAKLENGLRILVPPFVGSGERVVVRTEDCTYVERADK